MTVHAMLTTVWNTLPDNCCATRQEYQIPWQPTDVVPVLWQWCAGVDSLALAHAASQRFPRSTTWERQNDPTGFYDIWQPCCWTSRRTVDNHTAMHTATHPCSRHPPRHTQTHPCSGHPPRHAHTHPHAPVIHLDTQTDTPRLQTST